MHIVAVTNIKGGVGKTTACVNLAYLSALAGNHTLLWDLDPQGAATFALGHDPAGKVSAKKLVSGKCEPLDVVVATHHDRLDLLPADLSFRKFDVHLSRSDFPTEWLLKTRHLLTRSYDVLFMDCPAGISLLSENVLRAADVIVTPIVPSPLSVRTLRQLRAFLDESGWSDIRLLPFFSMVDRRRSLHADIIDSTRAAFPAMLATEIRYSSDIERMSVRRAPIPSYAPGSSASAAYEALWHEITLNVPALRPSRLPMTASNAGATAQPAVEAR